MVVDVVRAEVASAVAIVHPEHERHDRRAGAAAEANAIVAELGAAHGDPGGVNGSVGGSVVGGVFGGVNGATSVAVSVLIVERMRLAPPTMSSRRCSASSRRFCSSSRRLSRRLSASSWRTQGGSSGGAFFGAMSRPPLGLGRPATDWGA